LVAKAIPPLAPTPKATTPENEPKNGGRTKAKMRSLHCEVNIGLVAKVKTGGTRAEPKKEEGKLLH